MHSQSTRLVRRIIRPFSCRTNGSASRESGQLLTVCWFALLLSLSWLVGCKSTSPSGYVSPRVTGRVLDETTRQPIEGVLVKRVVPDYEAGTMDQVRGGETLQRLQPLRTAADGTFDLDSQKSVALFRQLSWFTVEISFTHHDYETLVTNYTPANAIFPPDGEPVIHAGDIWLQPKPR